MVKQRENRVPMMLSDEELQAIDDWRYQNKVPTRSDAIRRLCQMALILDARLTPLTNAVNDHSKELGDLVLGISDLVNPKSDKKSAIERLGLLMKATSNQLSRLRYTIREITGRAYDFKKGTSFEVSLADSAENEKVFQEMISTLTEIGNLQTELKKHSSNQNSSEVEE